MFAAASLSLVSSTVIFNTQTAVLPLRGATANAHHDKWHTHAYEPLCGNEELRSDADQRLIRMVYLVAVPLHRVSLSQRNARSCRGSLNLLEDPASAIDQLRCADFNRVSGRRDNRCTPTGDRREHGRVAGTSRVQETSADLRRSCR